MMKRFHLIILTTALLWAASMFIEVVDFYPHGVSHPTYVHSLYNWAIGLVRHPGQVLTHLSGWLVCAVFAAIDALHITLCFGLAWLLCWLYAFVRGYVKSKINVASQCTASNLAIASLL
jgi:hypothetical protein